MKEFRPQVTLVDIDLSEESGFDVVRRLQSEAAVPPAGVILISTHAEEDFRDLFAVSPAAGLLPKLQLSASEIERVLQGSRTTDRVDLS